MALILINLRALLPDGAIARVELRLADGRIVEIAPRLGGDGAPRLDGGGLLLLPGIIDLHGDAFERQLMPRPRVHVAPNIGLLDSDRQLLANGITTAYHGVTVSWEPGLRGVDAGRAFLEALAAVRPHLACDTRVHLRFEQFNVDAAAEVEAWIERGLVDLLAFNEHTGDIGRHVAQGKVASYCARTGLDEAAFAALFHRVCARADAVPAASARLAAAAQRRNLPMASHDDDSVATRMRFRALGCRISEFPYGAEIARAALSVGDTVVLGAPNVIRGGSHAGRLDAAQAVRDGLCSVLTSDYYYPAPLHAAFALVRAGGVGLKAAWDLVSANAAAAVGLGDRGVIAAGRRADLVLVDDRDPALPVVAATVAAGRPVYLGPSLVAHGWHPAAQPATLPA
ncbi:MAG: alpha-D-ribose 1-methylphosphonate 5-triphosphate diphosphatase [Proteobacteria bacterium]|nr:alpha-D-ribose 1-methylphosphonate 5-triphosphate diphosphatase [Pseudomonadota bacterium]